ncbi:DUF814 domain-containing protein [Candidatus Woesearchaeota archaeon]|nr:DUF814 domain-containing protein [Candidatus Woesearchaeota archaeon]
MKIVLDMRKTLQQNAALYFEQAKKAKKKLAGAVAMLEKAKRDREQEQQKIQHQQEKAAEKQEAVKRKMQWYEKFRWFKSSEGFLVIGGRDATTNEIVIKKHTEKHDVVFHTDMAGSPFFVVKKNSNSGKEIGAATIQEVANATCTFSRAWKLGLTSIEVFWVKPEQVSKTTEAGEYMPKGAFMIRGKTNYISVEMDCAIGITAEGEIMAGPLAAVQQHCTKLLKVLQGHEKASDLAKRIRKQVGGELDEIIRVLPAGGGKITK